MAAVANLTGTWKGVAGTRLINITIDRTANAQELVAWYRFMEADGLGAKTMFTAVNYNHDNSIVKLEDSRVNLTLTCWVVGPAANTQIVGTTSQPNESVLLVKN